MSGRQVQIRRDTDAVINAIVPADGELYLKTTTNQPGIGDGVTPGGIEIARRDQLPQPAVGFANRTVNGDMAIDQVAEGAAYAVSGTTAQTLDAWKCAAFGGGALSIQRVANTVKIGLTEDFAYSQRAVVTAADASLAASDVYALQQAILPDDLSDLGYGSSLAKTTTLSFWAKSNVTGTYYARLAEYGATRSYVFAFTIGGSNTWQRVTKTIPGDTSGTWTSGAQIAITLGSGSNYYTPTLETWQGGSYFAYSGGANFMAGLSNSFEITGVQLEVGSTANGYARETPAVAMARAQQRLQKSYPAGVAVGTATREASVYWRPSVVATTDWASVQLPVKMISTPAVTLYSTATGASGKVYNQGSAVDVAATVVDVANSGFGINHEATATFQGHRAHWVADARP